MSDERNIGGCLFFVWVITLHALLFLMAREIIHIRRTLESQEAPAAEKQK